MIVISDPQELRRQLAEYRTSGQTTGFVPTMGALHEGHLSLVRQAREQAARVIVSVFVNPTQFGPHEDYRVYPRNLEKDAELLESEGVDVVFAPTAKVMYPEGWAVTVQPGPVGSVFEGAIRPGHFAGVLTVVAKLFNLVQPDVAVFGQKDAQQLFLIRRMVEDLNFSVRIVAGETAREEDGLARSSRNVYLKLAERQKATVLYRALMAGQQVFERGERSLTRVRLAMQEALASVPEFVPDYRTVVGEESFAEEDPVPTAARAIVAGKLGAVLGPPKVHRYF